MGLFGSVWKTSDADKHDEAVAAAKKVTDPKVLRKKAMSAYFDDIRLDALRRIDDPEILAKLALTFDTLISAEAIKRIKDDAVLKKIVIGDNGALSELALRQINDQTILKEITATVNGDLRKKALSRIHDNGMLKESALGNTYDAAEAIQAISQISDTAVLKEIALSTAATSHKQAAVNRLHDLHADKELGDIICSGDSSIAIYDAIRFTNDYLILKKAFRFSSPEIQRAIWKKLPLSDARQIAQEWNVPETDMCRRMRDHCNAPGPMQHEIEEDFDKGFTEHEYRYCELCNRLMWARSKPTAVWGEWTGGYIAPEK